MRIRLPWWAAASDHPTDVPLFFAVVILGTFLDGAAWVVLVALAFLVVLAKSRLAGWTLAPNAVRIHPGLFRRTVEIPWPEVQAVVTVRVGRGWSLAFWTPAQGLQPSRFRRGPDLRAGRAEKIRARIEEEWIAQRGPNWRPLPGPWNPEPAPVYDFGPDPFAPPPSPA
jgi:hypothetical protein